MVLGKNGNGNRFFIMGMGGNGNGNGFMGMGGNGNRNSPSRTPLVQGHTVIQGCIST